MHAFLHFTYQVRMQRRHYKLLNEGGYSSLTDDRIKKLDDINFQWSVKESWDDMYHKLLGFRDQYGHCNVRTMGLYIHLHSTCFSTNLFFSTSGSPEVEGRPKAWCMGTPSAQVSKNIVSRNQLINDPILISRNTSLVTF
jgi:hypothetical protein